MLSANAITEQNLWHPFRCSLKPDLVRPLAGLGGVEDRLRVVAFAELQARDMFLWGAEHFSQAPSQWRQTWKAFSDVENRHAQMLLNRMSELGHEPGARKVSHKLSRLCRLAPDHESFLFFLSSAEERGMEAGLIISQQMLEVDHLSANIFRAIAEEEREHVEFSDRIFRDKDIIALKELAKKLSRTIEE